MKIDEKQVWIHISLKVSLMIVIVFMLGLIIGSKTRFDIQKYPVDTAALIGALATVAIAFLTFFLAAETWRLRRAQDAQMEEIRKESIRPLIEIFIEQSNTHFQIFNLKVENVGKGIAKDISFELIGRKTPLLESEIYFLDKLNSISFFKKSISVLGIGKSRSSFLFSFQQFASNSKGKAFEVCLPFKIVCHDSDGTSYITNSVIDLSEFEGMSQAGVNPVYESYRELKKISKNIGLIAGGKKLNIDLCIPTKQEKEDKEEWDRQVSEYLNAPND